MSHPFNLHDWQGWLNLFIVGNMIMIGKTQMVQSIAYSTSSKLQVHMGPNLMILVGVMLLLYLRFQLSNKLPLAGIGLLSL